MLLTYIDESGINYKKDENNFYKDGPYLIWCGILVPENKYFHLERLFCDLLKEVGIRNWSIIEAHATNIWSRKEEFAKLSENKVKNYFEELFQLLSKLNIHTVIAIQKKFAQERHTSMQKKERENCKYSLLHGLEHKLSGLNETGIIISDHTDEVLDTLLFERTKWRYNPGARKTRKIKSKFRYESQSCFLLDRVHSVDSKGSLFLQIADHVAFVIQRVFTYLHLRDYPIPALPAKKEKVPISSPTFNMFCNNALLTSFDENENDVNFIPLDVFPSQDNYFQRISFLFQKPKKQPNPDNAAISTT